MCNNIAKMLRVCEFLAHIAAWLNYAATVIDVLFYCLLTFFVVVLSLLLDMYCVYVVSCSHTFRMLVESNQSQLVLFSIMFNGVRIHPFTPRLRNSWSVSNFVSVVVTEAETKVYVQPLKTLFQISLRCKVNAPSETHIKCHLYGYQNDRSFNVLVCRTRNL